MAFPRKFKEQLEKGIDDVKSPDYIYLVYSVCCTEEDSCGWEGWMLESAYRKSTEKHATLTGDEILEASDDQICPRCGKTTFRTDATLKFTRSKDQSSRLVAGVDYEVAPLEYTDDE